MQNAAIYFHADAIDTTRGRLLGRHSAGESFLRGFFRHADVDAFHLWNVSGQPQSTLDQLIKGVGEPTKPIHWIGQNGRNAIAPLGVLNMPTPQITSEAWHRRTSGSRAYAICGITHTTASAGVMGLIGDMLVAPLESHDALICTSTAVRASVESQLDGVREYLGQEYGPRHRPELQRVTIPLGVNTEDFTVSGADRAAWRARLGIPDDAIVALYVGRFNVSAKMNPALMALALEKVAVATGKEIYWVNSGWAESEGQGEIYHRESRALCPSIKYIEVDGRPADVRFSIWSVADFFISFSDNIQETFGLTPIEAMAAGLPCVVSDWNGYKDTVRHGEDGFRIATTAPPPGMGGDLAFRFANDWLNYSNYVAATAQYVSIDYAQAVSAISALVLDADLRARLGAQAKARARTVFDWAAIIPQYQALWAEQDARRRAAPPESVSGDNPFRPDPYRLFGNYPTRHLGVDDRLTLTPGMTWPLAQVLLASPLVSYSPLNRPHPPEVEMILQWLAPRTAPRVQELLEIFPAPRRPFIRRGLLWLARYDLIQIAPAS